MFEGRIDSFANATRMFIQISGTLLLVAILLYLKKFLNSLFKFHDIDRNIALMIMASMMTGAILLGAFSFPPLKESLGSVLIVILVAQGIVQARLGYKLLRLPNNLGGMLKPFCYASMATGICVASVILMPLGILASAISDLMLGTIFFNMASLVTAQQAEAS
jgi:hypothetical protein